MVVRYKVHPEPSFKDPCHDTRTYVVNKHVHVHVHVHCCEHCCKKKRSK